MKSRRNVVAALAVLALLYASPSNADWENPGGDAAPVEVGLDDMNLAAQWSLQIAQAAF